MSDETPLPPAVPGAAGRVPRWAVWAAIALLAAMAACSIARFAWASAVQLTTPFDLCYESPSLGSIRVIQAGLNPYSPSTYAAAPFILTMYTPLYYYLTALLPAPESNPFLSGRIVSLLATLSILPALLLVASPRRRWWPALLAFGLLAGVWSVIRLGIYLKCDAMSMVLGGWAVALLSLPGERRWPLAWGMAMAVLAIVTKQAAVAAGAAGILFLLWRRPPHWRLALGVFAGCSAVFVIGATLLWGSGFWHSTVGLVGQPINLTYAWEVVFMELIPQQMFWVLMAVALLLTVDAVRRQGRVILLETPLFLFVAISLVLAVAASFRVGGAVNYYAEPALAAALWVTWLLSRHSCPPLAERGWIAIVAAGLVAAAGFSDMTFASWTQFSYGHDDAAGRAMRQAYAAGLEQDLVSLAPSPDRRVLDLFDHRHHYTASRFGHVNDPFLYRLLWEQDRLPTEPLQQAIREGYFDVIVVPDSLQLGTGGAMPELYHLFMNAAVGSYRLARVHAGNHYLVRRGE